MMVHQYKLNGYNIVVDACSGAIHTVKPLVARIPRELPYVVCQRFPVIAIPRFIFRVKDHRLQRVLE